jgi:hypothetical protein
LEARRGRENGATAPSDSGPAWKRDEGAKTARPHRAIRAFVEDLVGPFLKAIERAVAHYRYHLQPAFDLRAVSEGRRLIAMGAVHGNVASEPVAALAQPHEMTWLWVWQQKGGGV